MALNVTTDFGANNLSGNGSTDNYAKLLNIQTSLTPPYTLYWPAGTYILSAELTVPANACWVGDGKNQTIIKGTRGSHLSDGVLTPSSNTTFREMHITTTDDANAVNRCFTLIGVQNVTLTNVKFSNGYASGLRSSAASQVLAQGCEFTNVHQDPTASLLSGTFQHSTFDACWFHDNNGLLNTNHCVYFNGTTPVASNNVAFTGCLFENFTGGCFDITGDPGNVFALAMEITGCTFITAAANGHVADFQTVYGLTLSGNTFYMTAGGGINLFGVQNFAIVGNTVNMQAGGQVWLGGLPDLPNFDGVISGNSVAQPTGIMQFGSGIHMYNAQNVNIHNNTFAGLYVGVLLFGAGSVSDVSIKDNRFIRPPGSTDIGTGYYFGNPNSYYGVAIDGAVSKVSVLDNVCTGLTSELFFVRYTYNGQADQVKFRSASWAGSNTNTFGFQGGAAPTNCTQLASAGAPFSATNTAHGYTNPAV